MTEPGSPATRLREVAIVNEQTGEQWRAGPARIHAGLILVEPGRVNPPPAGFLGHPAATYTIAALDGTGRARRFFHTRYDADRSRPPRVYVFL